MPYRRLPNTDQARLRAFRTVIQQSDKQDFVNQIVNPKTLHEAKTFLSRFEKHLYQYQQTLENQVSANKRYQQFIHNARIYISHFIQVLNLSVIRGDIKKEHKIAYHLDIQNHTVPDLSTETALLEWGKHIIDGENERVRNGGLPIYNPAIAKVQVHYEIFKEYKSTQKFHQQTTTRTWEDLVSLREVGDKIILELWNQIEGKFANEKPFARINKCTEFGIVYYYRRGEKQLTADNDLSE